MQIDVSKETEARLNLVVECILRNFPTAELSIKRKAGRVTLSIKDKGITAPVLETTTTP